MRKLVVLPAAQQTLGGAAISLCSSIAGFKQWGKSEQLCVLVQAGSLLEQYLRQEEQVSCLQTIAAQNSTQFVKSALQWVGKQPQDYPLLLENCDDRQVLLTLALATPALRFSGRPIYYFFHDQARSHNSLGNLARKLTFACLSPGAICNSQFTAKYIQNSLVSKIQGIIYQPIDARQFNQLPVPPPANLQPILRSGARVMLTPSRITAPGKVNDKNLRSLLPVLAHLKTIGHHYHGVVIGHDYSPNQIQTQALLDRAECLGVADRFTVLPPTFAIDQYYKHADVVVTLAPREPFGRTVIEAIACGVPVVGSNTGGIGEILHNFAPEWTVDPFDPIAAAEAIVRIVAHPNTSNLLAKGRFWIETHCNAVDYARKIAAIAGLTSADLTQTAIGCSLI